MSDAAGWRPIETAPRDGTPVLAWPCWVGAWSVACVHWYETTRGRQGGRRGWAYYGHQRVGLEPTHWMPLPDPPK